jgi:hypothetical protein
MRLCLPKIRALDLLYERDQLVDRDLLCSSHARHHRPLPQPARLSRSMALHGRHHRGARTGEVLLLVVRL